MEWQEAWMMLGKYRDYDGKQYYDDHLLVTPDSLKYSYEGKTVHWKCRIRQSGNLYFWMGNCRYGDWQDLSLYLNGKMIGTYGNESNTRVMNLGYYQKGDILNAEVRSNTDDEVEGSIDLKSENTEFLKQIHNQLLPSFCSNVRIKGTHLSFRMDNKCKAIATSIPYDPQWKIRVNGEERKTGVMPYGMIEIGIYKTDLYPLQVEMDYQPAGLIQGIAVSLMAGCVFLLTVLWGIYLPHRIKKIH